MNAIKVICSFILKVAAMAAVTALMLRIGDVLAHKVAKKDHHINIIGGADGPTAIYVTTRVNHEAISGIFAKAANMLSGLVQRVLA